ncbi:MAG: VWA domain-containing protein [Clostridia bacterium]|nr:VWA domain-containing protein [Clostridia bacterium]MBQ4586426.1 VWA domain-containing protein [Clostridia bacterium]
MNNNLTELVFILDKSGSMAGLESDTIGGFNAMIEKQKGVEGKAVVTTVLFSNTSRILHDRIPLEDIKPLTDKDYTPAGGTALLDAIGVTIDRIDKTHKTLSEENLPAHTIFVITTDGHENASVEYTQEDIKNAIKEHEEQFGWEFLFLAANIDAFDVGMRFGFSRDKVANYSARHATDDFYCKLDEVIADFRKDGKLKKDWALEIEKTKNLDLPPEDDIKF